MKSVDQLRGFFQSDLSGEIRKLEGKRKMIVFKIVALIILLTILFIASIIAILHFKLSIGWIVLSVLVFGAMGYVFVSDIAGNKDFYIDFKVKVIEQIVRFIDKSFSYNPHKFIPLGEFKESMIFTDHVTEYKGDDYVNGFIGANIRVEFSEIVAGTKDKNDKKGENKPLFKGLYFVAHLPENFASETVVKARVSGKAPLPTHNGQQLVETGDPLFDKHFATFSTDGNESKRILSSVLRSTLNEIKNHLHEDFVVSFVNNKIFVAISHQKDLFEPSVFHSLNDFSLVEGYYNDLFDAITLVEKIQAQTAGNTMEKSVV